MPNVIENGEIVNSYQSFIAKSRYSRWLPDENRRETWEETVTRYTDFMSKTDAGSRLPELFWNEAHKAILNLEVMPSMRALMTAGPALERENLAQFNCSFIAIDDQRAFDEALYILMNGVGLGFSVEADYVSQLPTVPLEIVPVDAEVKVADSKAGWAKAYREVIAHLYAGQIPRVNVSGVREEGARLKTFGGRASGPQPLVDLFDFTIGKFLNARGRKLNTLECHDIMCKVGEVVVVGGVRRSALISLSDLSDYNMSKAKSGAWYDENSQDYEPQRALANNSAVYNVKPPVGQFLEEWATLINSHSGERGIFNRQSALKGNDRRDWTKVQGTNPCGEILLRSKGLCNLTEVIVQGNDTIEDLHHKVYIATVLGTVQSSLTDFKYLRKVWKDNADEERLLGVSMTGQFGHKVLNGSDGLENTANWLKALKATAILVNREYAEKIGINPSVAITTVKPSGTVSQLTNSAAGMHPWHNDYYIRTVRADNKDPMTEFLISIGVPNEPAYGKAKDKTTIFSFPIAAPEGALTRNDLTALQHLEIWKVYKEYWTEHNPSVTINVRKDEWIGVADWVYQNWDVVGGLSFNETDDNVYVQAPYQDATKEVYEDFKSQEQIIDWSFLEFYEFEDTTSGSQTLACTAANCEVVDVG